MPNNQPFNQMLREDNRAMRLAGGRLAEAALYTVHHYYGLHRLADAAAEWAKTVSSESNRSRFMTRPPAAFADTPRPTGEGLANTLRLAREDAAYLLRIADEADDNGWQDWAATMRQSAERINTMAALLAQREQEGWRKAVHEVADRLLDHSDAPTWFGGNYAKRMKYWRDKAINAANALKALPTPPVEEGAGAAPPRL